MMMKIHDLNPRHLPRLSHLHDLAHLPHELHPLAAREADEALARAAHGEVASLVVAVLALLGITLALSVLGAPGPAPQPFPQRSLRAAPLTSGLQVPAVTAAAPHAIPTRLSFHGR